MKFTLQAYIAGLGLLCALFLSGCGLVGPSVQGNFTANTTASYKMTQYGPEIFYSSNKDQQGFKADVELDKDGKPTKFHVETTANTNAEAMTATGNALTETAKSLGAQTQVLAPIVTGAIKGGLIGGGPGVAAGAAAGALSAKPVPSPAPAQ